MASLNSMLEEEQELNKELECPVCLDTLKKPKLLACTHTFCLNCLENLVKENEDGTNEIPCPTCREVTKIKENAASLYPNYIVQNLIKKLQDTSSGSTMKCGECVDSENADQFCHDCKMAMCTNCTEHHRKSKRFAQHRMESIGSVKPEKLHNTYQYCATHNELLKYFCKECSVMVCHDCMISKAHCKHERGLIEEILDDKKEEIDALVTKGKEAVGNVQTFMEKADKCLAEALELKDKSVDVEDAFNSIIQALNERKEYFLGKVNEPYNKSVKSVEQAKQKGKVLNDMLQYAVKLVGSEEGENLEALSGMITQLTESLSECDVKEGEKVKRIVVLQQRPQYNNNNIRGNVMYLANDGKCYYKDEKEEYFAMLHDGVYYDEIKEQTLHYQFLEKKLLSNSKVGTIDVEIQRLEAVVLDRHMIFVNSCKTL